jgi:hypothetical protein
MKLVRMSGLAVAATLAGATVAGCGSEPSSTPSSSAASSRSSATSSPLSEGPTSAVAQPNDYSALLVRPTEIGPDIVPLAPPLLNPDNTPGVGQVYTSADRTRQITDTIVVFDDPAAAASNFDSNKATLNTIVTGTPQPAEVGQNGTVAAGTSPDGAKAVTVVMFNEGRALVHLKFDSAPNVPVLPEIALEVARKQDAAVKNGLPG